MPVQYIVLSGISDDQIASLIGGINSVGAKWSIMDWIHCYSRTGDKREEYLNLLHFLEGNPIDRGSSGDALSFLDFRTLASSGRNKLSNGVGGRGSGNSPGRLESSSGGNSIVRNRDIKNGRMHVAITLYNRVRCNVGRCNAIINSQGANNEQWNMFRHQRRFKRAVVLVVAHRDYEHERMMRLLANSVVASQIVRSRSVLDYVKKFELAYNFDTQNTGSPDCVAFI